MAAIVEHVRGGVTCGYWFTCCYSVWDLRIGLFL